MPLKNYSLLKGRATDLTLDDDSSPHIEIELVENGTKHRIAVNVRSKIHPHDLLYLRYDRFEHPNLSDLESLNPGRYDLARDHPGLTLDYVSDGLFSREDMSIAPFQASGPSNDLRDFIEPIVRQGIEDSSVEFYAFGETWGPEPGKPDKYFGFEPGNGIHDIHMNQGSSGQFAHTNGSNQDGALWVRIPSEGRWVAIFLAFQSQSWAADGSLPIPPKHPAPALDASIKIIAALINPIGEEAGTETVTIFNRTDSSVVIDDWSIVDHERRSLKLAGKIDPGEAHRVTLVDEAGAPRLSNKGGKISLIDPDGAIADVVIYDKAEAAREGWSTVF